MVVAFVAGATGYTGQAVVKALCDAGHAVTAHVRPDSKRLQHFEQAFGAQGATVSACKWKAEDISKALRTINPDLVFSLLGTTRARTKADKKEGFESTYETVDYGLTKLLIDALVRNSQTPRFVYLSSMGAGGEPSGAYMAARAKSEKALIESGIPYTIARPSFITGSDRDEARTGERIGAGTVDALLAVVGLFGAKQLQARYRSTTATTLAESLVRHSLDSASENQVLLSDQLKASD